MYLEFFNLKEFPFSIACDERFFYESAIHAEALSNMVYAVSQRKGMVLISGQVGAGKTFLGSMLASRLGLAAMVVPIKHPPASAKQLLRALGIGLGLKIARETDITAIADEVEGQLQKLHHRNRLVTLLIDEVQDLTDEALEEVRLIWNWELESQRLVQIILVGQPEIRQRLTHPRWESLRQRIVLSYHLGRLSAEETSDYIRHRITVAANGESSENLPAFSQEALDAIHKATQGTPRLVNSLCDNALLTAYARETREITDKIVDTVLLSMTFWAADSAGQDDPAPEARQAPNPPASKSAAKPTPAPTAPPPAKTAAPPSASTAEQPQPPKADPAPAEAPQADARDTDCPDEIQPAKAPEADAETETGEDPAESSELLQAALLGDPSAKVAREVYRRAPQDSDAHHLAVRVLAERLLSRLSAERKQNET